MCSAQQRKAHIPHEPATRIRTQNVSRSNPTTYKVSNVIIPARFDSGMKNGLCSKTPNSETHPVNKLRRKNQTVITLDVTEGLDKTQHPFFIKHAAKLEQEELAPADRGQA